MNRNNLSVGIRLVCFVLSDTINIKGGQHSWAAFVCLEKQTEIYEKIVKFNRIIRPVFAVFNKSKETVKKRLLFSAESFIILFVFSEWIIQ